MGNARQSWLSPIETPLYTVRYTGGLAYHAEMMPSSSGNGDELQLTLLELAVVAHDVDDAGPKA